MLNKFQKSCLASHFVSSVSALQTKIEGQFFDAELLVAS